MIQRPELLAPAGSWDCLVAAIENGADAVYFGLDHGFNARARANNFRVDELPAIMSRLHRHGVHGYVTLNTLIFSDELDELCGTIESVAQAGVDAVLVQDLGVTRLVRAIAPSLPIHASTQMTMTSAETIRVAERLGVERVVLARELSIDEILKIRSQTDMPLEVFVHGALCVAYSGQCLTSESLGGRSANRGQCAQACRLPYDLICDGEDVPLDNVKYLLSPQDLAAFELLPRLIAGGIASFKIEGRLKTPEYVANITHHYRQAIDEACQGTPHDFSADEVHDMEMSFSRGFSPGWLEGCDHKMLVPGVSSAKRGVRVGEVVEVRGERVRVRVELPLACGDGLLFAARQERDEEQGGRVFEIWEGKRSVPRTTDVGTVDLGFDRQRFDPSRLYPGQEVWKTDDPQLTRRWRKTWERADTQRRLPLELNVVAREGETLKVRVKAEPEVDLMVESAEPLQTAQRHVLDHETLAKQLGRLGGTTFELAELSVEIEGRPMLPLSLLGRLRKEMVAAVEEAVDQSLVRDVTPLNWRSLLSGATGDELRGSGATSVGDGSTQASGLGLSVLCRTLEQLEAVGQLDVGDLYVDFHDTRRYRDAIALTQPLGRRLWLAPTRIQKPGEMGLIRKIAGYGGDGLLARNLATVEFARESGVPFVVDFSLNITNPLTAQWFREQGPVRWTASYDLNRDQLLGLIESAGAEQMEVVIHQHMPMFHMEHCVFCALLSPGTNKTNCGRPCDDHQVKLRDRIGREHPLHADIACRNTLFNATPQSGAEAVPELLQRGVKHYRLELLEETAQQAQDVVELYRQLLAGQIRGQEVWQRLKASNRVGVTRGTLEEPRNPLAIL